MTEYNTEAGFSGFSLNLQCNEKIISGVFSNSEAGPFEVHKGHG